MVDKYDFSEADQFYLNSLCSYYEGDIVTAMSHLKSSLAEDPDHKKSKMMLDHLGKQKKLKIHGDEFIFIFNCVTRIDYSLYDDFILTKYIHSNCRQYQIFRGKIPRCCRMF